MLQAQHTGTYRHLDRAEERLAAAGVDALLLTPGADMTYLTGFEHSHAGERLRVEGVDEAGRGAIGLIAPPARSGHCTVQHPLAHRIQTFSSLFTHRQRVVAIRTSVEDAENRSGQDHRRGR